MALPIPLVGSLVSQQSWQERVRQGAYKAPSGKRVTFDFESVSREITLRRPAFEFQGINDAYVQENGFGARSYPLACFFSGPNHDHDATAFEVALLEPGTGQLEHPFYGTFNVVCTGTITRRDDLKEAANQSVVEVTFTTTTGAVYPSKKVSAKNEIQAQLDLLALTCAASFAAKANISNTLARANLKATIRSFLRKTSSALSAVASKVSSVNAEFTDAQRLVNESIDVLIGQPLLLARQVTNLVTAPGRALLGLASRLEAYDALLSSIIGSAEASSTEVVPGIPGTSVSRAKLIARKTNDFHAADLFTASSLAGSATSALNNAYTTRPEAISAAVRVAASLDLITPWRDAKHDALEIIDDGASYQVMQSLSARVAGYLVDASFSLVPERAIVLDRPRTIIDLAAEIYGEVDSRLDFIINTNGLTGSEILELPRGRRIVYYV